MDEDFSEEGVAHKLSANEEDDDNEEDDEYDEHSDDSFQQAPLIDIRNDGWDDSAITKCFELACNYDQYGENTCGDGETPYKQMVFEPTPNKLLNGQESSTCHSNIELDRMDTNEQYKQRNLPETESESSQQSDQVHSGQSGLTLPSWAL
jgi:hypothetical protein